MFSGLLTWVSSFGVKTQFQASILKASYPDEYPPDQPSIQIILTAFEGKSEQIRAQVAITEFFKILNKGDYRTYWQFVLKMLLVMDRCLQHRVMIQEITAYENESLQQFQGGGQGQSSSLTNSLVSQYYMYIKRKGTAYSLPRSIFLVKSRERLNIISRMSTESIGVSINTAQELQADVLKISNGYKNGNKKPKLVQYVFCNLLSTALSAYTIQSICTSILITKIPSMDFHQLMQTKLHIEQMNKTTKETVKFIETNKEMDGFKDLKYNQFFTFDSRVFTILQDAIKSFDSNRKSYVRDVDVEQWKPDQHNLLEVSRSSLQKRVYKENTHFLPGKQRKTITPSKQDDAQMLFRGFKNDYSQVFRVQSSEQLAKQKLIGTSNSNMAPDSQGTRAITYTKNSKFNEKVWENFQNLLS